MSQAISRLLIANWKMNVPPEGVEAYLACVGGSDPRDVDIVIAPPYTLLRAVVEHGAGLSGAAQNCSDHLSGAFTGEISPAMLRACGVDYVILGHSERRHLFHESDALIARKVSLAIETGLIPVLCIGEDLRVRDAGQVATFLADQIRATAVPELEKAEAVVIAYEPVWAIGTGRNASGVMVAETLETIRHALERFWPLAHRQAPILYGGSVTPDNVDELVRDGGVDGFLVGGASLDSRKFLAIHAGMR